MEKIVRVVYKYTNPNSATVLLVGMNVCPVMGHTFMCPVFNSYDHGSINKCLCTTLLKFSQKGVNHSMCLLHQNKNKINKLSLK